MRKCTTFCELKKAGYVDVDIHDINIGALSAIDAVRGEEIPNPSDGSLVPNTDANERLIKALKVVVGAALIDAGFGKQ